MFSAWLQGPLQNPFDHWQSVAVTFMRQASWVAAIAQSWPSFGFVVHTGVAVQPGRHCDAWSP